MSNTPTIPPGSTPPVPPFWGNEEDWIVVIEFLRRDDHEDFARGTEAIGYMFAFAKITDTRMLALVGDSKTNAYELLFSFSAPANKAESLHLLQSHEKTRCEGDMIMAPRQNEIEAAQPIARVLPADVMRQVTVIAMMLYSESSDTPPAVSHPSHIDCTV